MQVSYWQYDVLHDADRNFARLESQLKEHQCELLILPELSICGYLFESRAALFSCAEEVPAGRSTQRMLDLSRRYACTILFGLAEREGEKVFNTAAVVSKGRYLGKYRKIHLSDFEKKLFDRGRENRVFEVDGVKLGVQICFDLWFPELSREQLRMGAQIFCVLANFGGETTYHIARLRAVENLTPLVLCNRVGVEKIPGMDADFLGKSGVIDAAGRRVCTAPEGEDAFCGCEIDPAKTRSNVICSNFEEEMAFHYPEC